MSRYHDDNTYATDPGKIRLCSEKLDYFRDLLPLTKRVLIGSRYPEARIDEHLQLGDSRAAVVVQVAPSLLVAAYSDEIDGVALLAFPELLVQVYEIQLGARLLTVNTYVHGTNVVADLLPGPGYLRRYENFYPIIAEFLSDQMDQIALRKQQISEEEWRKTWEMGVDALQTRRAHPRSGNPYQSCTPSTLIR